MPNAPCDLPDLNVWLALVDRRHAHHARAERYWREEAAASIGFCGVSLTGLLRLGTNPKVLRGRPFTAEEIWQAAASYLQLPGVIFLREPEGLVAQMRAWSDQPGFPRDGWTDCYLAAVALLTGSRLVTFDRDFSRFPGLDYLLLEG